MLFEKKEEQNTTFEGYDLKRVTRKELIEILYEMKKREVELQNQLDEANKKLEDRTIRLQSAGSIAEASLAINDIFTVAQQSANDYLSSIRAAQEESKQLIQLTRAKSEEVIATTKSKAQQIMNDANQECASKKEETQKLVDAQLQEAETKKKETQEYCDKLLDATNVEIKERWEAFNQKVNDVLQAHHQLSGYLLTPKTSEEEQQ